MAIICFVISDFIRQCSFEIHNIGNFLIIYIRHKSPLTPCDIMVASAAPDTPSLKTIINVRSSIIFKILEKTRNKNGVLLSPTALSSPDKKLYKLFMFLVYHRFHVCKTSNYAKTGPNLQTPAEICAPGTPSYENHCMRR